MYIHIYTSVHTYMHLAIGQGRVRFSSATLFLLSLLTPLPPQRILGAQSTHSNQRYSLHWVTLRKEGRKEAHDGKNAGELPSQEAQGHQE